MFRFISLMFFILVTGCSTSITDETTMPEGLSACPEERPQICSMIYAPVCALTDAGERKTFASDCVACGDENVIAFEKGGPCSD